MNTATITATTPADTFAEQTEATTLTIRRHLPTSLERAWAYLTDGELRRRWLAAGAMEQRVGASFELLWRNDELTVPPGQRPEGFGAEHRAECRITALEPLRRLDFAWPGTGEVSFTLQAEADGVLLTVTHRRLEARPQRLMVGAGWHAHLDVLQALCACTSPAPFWDRWTSLRALYDARLAA